MNEKLRDEKTDLLFRAILSLDNLEECYRFFEDLCTISEIQEMSRRMTAAQLLSDGYIYNEIADQTGLSTATISRVNRSLIYGCDAYDMVFGRMKDKNIPLPYAEEEE